MPIYPPFNRCESHVWIDKATCSHSNASQMIIRLDRCLKCNLLDLCKWNSTLAEWGFSSFTQMQATVQPKNLRVQFSNWWRTNLSRECGIVPYGSKKRSLWGMTWCCCTYDWVFVMSDCWRSFILLLGKVRMRCKLYLTYIQTFPLH